PTLQANVRNVRVCSRQRPTTSKESGHVPDFQFREKIVFIRAVTDRPKQSCSRSFGLGFQAKFRTPFFSIAILHVELRSGSMHILLHELNRRFRLMLLSSWSPVQISRANVSRIDPQNLSLFGGRRCFLRPRAWDR